MASQASSSVYKVTASFTCGGSTYGVSSFSVEWGMNKIPTASLLLPLVGGGSSGETVVHTDNDPSQKSDVFEMMQAAADSRMSCECTFKVVPVTGSAHGNDNGIDMTLSNWIVAQACLDPQNRVSPGGVRVFIEHRISNLASTPGFFSPPDTAFINRLVEKIDPCDPDVVVIADTVLDALYDVNNDKNVSLVFAEGSETPGSEKLGDYIDSGDIAKKLPYTHLFTDGSDADGSFSELVSKACKRSIAKWFMQHVTVSSGSTPWASLVTLLSDLGAYVRVLPMEGNGNSGKTATLHVLDPWYDRPGGDGNDPPDTYAGVTAEVKSSPDAYPICGIRVKGLSETDALVQSTTSDQTPIDQEDEKAATGDTVYYHKAYGRVVTVDVPEFAKAMVGEAAAMQASGTGGGHTTTGERRIVSFTKFDEELYKDMQVVAGSEVKAGEIVRDILKATAETRFSEMFRSSAITNVSLAGVVGYDFLQKPGEFLAISTGVGPSSVVGVVNSVRVSGSCSGGSCVIQYSLSHTGRAGLLGQSAPKNKVWEQSQSE